MLSVLIETRDSEKPLAHTLSALVPAVVDGLVRRVTVIDHGSRDDTALAAAGAGCAFFEDGRIGAALAEIVTDWVLLLQPGALPQPGWEAAARNHMETSGAPARFTAAGTGAFRKIFGGGGMEAGLLARLETVRPPLLEGVAFADLPRRFRLVRLKAEIGLYRS